MTTTNRSLSPIRLANATARPGDRVRFMGRLVGRLVRDAGNGYVVVSDGPHSSDEYKAADLERADVGAVAL